MRSQVDGCWQRKPDSTLLPPAWKSTQQGPQSGGGGQGDRILIGHALFVRNSDLSGHLYFPYLFIFKISFICF